MRDDDVIPIRRAEGFVEIGGLIDETRITLGFHGNDLDPDEITRVLGCPPTRSHRRGDPRPRNVTLWSRGAWLLSIEGKAPAEPEQLLTELLDRLPSDPRLWANLRSQFDVVLRIGLFQRAWNRGFELSSEMLRRVVGLGLGLDFDIYADEDGD